MYPTTSDPWPGVFVRDQVEDLRALGIKVDVLAFDGRMQKSEYLRAARRLRAASLRRRYDVIHAHHGLSGAAALASGVRIPIVTTFHGSETGYIPWQFRVSRVVAKLTTPIVVDQSAACRLRVPGAAVIPCGIDVGAFLPERRTRARAQLNLDTETYLALFPGARSRRVKRIDLFDAAMDRVRERGWRVKTATLEGFRRDEVASLFAAADVLVMTSDSEGSPLSVKEALASCTPVVSVPVGDVPHVIGGLPGCAIVERSPVALANAVINALRSERSPALRSRVLPMSREATARRVADLYMRTVRKA